MKTYNLNHAKLNDWEERKHEGTSFWQNTKTGEQSQVNPAQAFFKKNRKEMRRRAEEKFRERVLMPVEQDLVRMQKRVEDACAEIEADIIR